MDKKTKKGKTFKALLLLHLLLVFYSIGGVFSKRAGQAPFMSLPFILDYGVIILILGIYAIAWQQIIKVLPLSLAFANKAITLVWGIIWGVVFFQETITPGKAAGAVIVMAGVLIFVTAQGREKDSNEQ